MRRLSLALALAGILGPAPVAADAFPVGLFGIRGTGDLAVLRGAGLDAAQSYLGDSAGLQALAQEASRQGITLLASSAGPVRYLADEPEVTGMAPAELCRRYAELKRKEPSTKAAVAFGSGAAAAAYSRCTDIVMVDWYPVPHLALDSVADQLDEARRGAGGKPAWMILQAFDWRDFPQRNPKKPRVGRFPDFSEIRFMTYLSIIHGAEGIFYYTFAKPGELTLKDSPEQWQAVQRIAGELRELKPILERGKPAEIPFSLAPGLEGWARDFGGRRYVIVLNRTRETLLLPEGAARPGEDGSLGPHQVLVLEKQAAAPWALLTAFLTAGLLVLGLTPAARAFALSRGIVDRPDPLKVQAAPVPYLGGAAILIGASLGLLAGGHFFAAIPGSWLAAMILGGSVIALVGLFDDVRGVSPALRLGSEFAVGLVFVSLVGLPWPLAGLLAILFPVACNAMNLVDGLDGLAAGLAVAFGFGGAVLGLSQGDAGMAMLCLVLVGSCLGFLKHSWAPAAIFMGDCGSLFLGFWIAAIAAYWISREPSWSRGAQMGALLAFPLADMGWAVIRRLWCRQGLFHGDRDHLYDVLARSGLGTAGSVTLCIVIGFAGVMLVVWGAS